MKFTSKKSVNNYFVLYKYEYINDMNNEDEIICYYNDFEELSKKLNIKYTYKRLIQEFNNYNSNIINIIIDNKKYKLAIFCEEKVDNLLVD